MGGLFRAPKPVAIAAPAPEPVAQAAPVVSPDAAASAARVDTQARARRGLAGTIVTSARGVLDPAPNLAGARKSLLGE